MSTIINTMFKIFATLLLGFYLNKKGIIDKATNKNLSALVVKFTCPALVISAVLGEKVSSSKSEVFSLFLIGIGIYCFLIPFSYLASKSLGVKKGNMGIYQFMLIFANVSFMGFPIGESLFGKTATFYNSIMHMSFNLLAFTYGVYLISKDKEIKSDFKFKNLLNAGMLSSIIAFFVYFSDLNVPVYIDDTLSFIGDITPTLSMIVLGSSIAEFQLKDMFSEKKIYFMALIRLIIMPIITYYVIKQFTSNDIIIGVATITLGLPVASMAVMLSNEYDGQIKLASTGVFITTLLSIITIPIITILLLR